MIKNTTAIAASSKKSIDFSCSEQEFDSDFGVGRNVFADHWLRGFDMETITIFFEPVETLSS
jgi:hypothetical protein